MAIVYIGKCGMKFMKKKTCQYGIQVCTGRFRALGATKYV
jgi:hypothetical protein